MAPTVFDGVEFNYKVLFVVVGNCHSGDADPIWQERLRIIFYGFLHQSVHFLGPLKFLFYPPTTDAYTI